MDDEAYITFVDSHAKGDGCNDNLDSVVHPVALDVLPARIGQIRVIKITGYAMVTFQIFSELLAVFARDAVDDATLAFEAGLEHDFDIIFDILHGLLVANLIDEIWSIEATLEVDDLLGDAQTLGYVILYFLCCSGCQS